MHEDERTSPAYQFTNDWFGITAKGFWDHLMPSLKPTKILEIGSYEGRSTCYLIDTLSHENDLEIHCIDTWEGGIEHEASQMSAVEQRFNSNCGLSIAKAKKKVDLICHKGWSGTELATLVANGKSSYFDFIYVDGSHQAPDVLCDAALSFLLLKVGGVIVFDDYTWSEPLPYGVDPIRCPKLAIDAFTNIYCRKVKLISGPLSQLYVRKVGD